MPGNVSVWDNAFHPHLCSPASPLGKDPRAPLGLPVATLPGVAVSGGGGLPSTLLLHPQNLRAQPPAPDGSLRKGAPGALRPAEPNCPDSPGSQINSTAGWRQQEANCTLSPLPHLQGGAPRSRPGRLRGRQRGGAGAWKPNLKLISFQRDNARPNKRKTF